MAELLVNEHAVGSLLDLGNTKVGGREGTAENTAEWRQRRDQDEEGPLEGVYYLLDSCFRG